MTTRLAQYWHPSWPLLRGALGHILLGGALVTGAGVGLYPLLGAPLQALGPALGVFAAVAAIALFFLPQHEPYRVFGPANRLTLARGAAAAFLAGPVGRAETVIEHGWLLLAIALIALILDGFDGYAARRKGLSSAYGARFDMEVDSLMILVLCGLAWTTGKVGPWIFFAGAARYLFVIAARALPALRRPLPPSKRRQTVCVVQVVALFLILIPQVPAWGAVAIGAIAVGSLTWSFATDIVWLMAHRAEASSEIEIKGEPQ